MLGFLNTSGTQASIDNVTEKLPTPASTMDGDLRSLDAAAAGARNVYPYSHHDIVQTPEAAAASRTSNFVIDNSIPGPAQTDKQRAKDNNWWTDAATWASWIVAPVVARAQLRAQDDDDT